MTNILKSHRVGHSSFADPQYGPHLFDLNRTGPAISIPDQMRRGYYAVVEALENGYIGSDKPLLVIGGGVAGLMAAMTAVEQRVNTWIIEKERLLYTQAYCSSRYVCPTQYDWPASHWRKGFFPHDREPMPFSWQRGVAAEVVKDLLKEKVNNFRSANRRMFHVLNSEFLDYDVVSVHGQWWVKPKLKDKELSDAFAMVLACAGFGTENTTAAPLPKLPPIGYSATNLAATSQPPYTGFRFWETDDYEEDDPLLGIRSGKMPKVIISGSGDGALQDFLRIVVRSGSLGQESISAGSLYETISRSWRRRTRRRLENDLQSVDRKFQAAINQAPSILDSTARKHHNCRAHQEAHKQYRRVINNLINNTRVWKQVTQTLNRVIKDLQTEITIRMIYPCSHLTPFYGLNRFLVMLIREYANKKYPTVRIFHPHTMVTNVSPSGASAAHLCGEPEQCHDKDHEIFWTAARCIDIPPAYISREHKFADGPYNVVIVRHGITPASRPDLLGGH